MATGTCPCGVGFELAATGRPKKYCSPACRVRISNAYQRQGLCRSCGKTFGYKAKGARFCPDCRYIARSVPDRGRALFVVDGVDHIDCTKCNERKPLDHFPAAKNYAHGRNSWCRACYVVYNKAREDKTLESYRKKTYGISVEDQREMWAAQSGKCASCKHPFTRLGNAHLDHNHTTGRVRAYLCGPCNHILGLCKEDLDHLIAVAEYLAHQRTLE